MLLVFVLVLVGVAGTGACIGYNLDLLDAHLIVFEKKLTMMMVTTVVVVVVVNMVDSHHLVGMQQIAHTC